MISLSTILEQYRNGDRGLLSYVELQALEKHLNAQEDRIKTLEARNADLERRDLYVTSCLV